VGLPHPAKLLRVRTPLLGGRGLAPLPAFSHIICIFIFKANFDAVPVSLIQAARIDGVPEWKILLRVMLPLAKPAIATNVILSFIWSWNDFLWPLIIIRDVEMQTMPLGLSTFLAYFEDTTGALYAFCVMVLVPGLLIFLLAQNQFIQGLTSGARKG
jgi:ABC-type glycerol-3-phosphate transport system permease component